MNTTKIIIVVVAVAALGLVAAGLASAQLQANQTYTGEQAPNSGFFGWIGNCFGLNGNQPYYGAPYQAPQGADGANTPEPNVPNQGGLGYGYGYGPCWAR